MRFMDQEEFISAVLETKKIVRQDKAWWAKNHPVMYIWLCRAERRGAIVPWTPR